MPWALLFGKKITLQCFFLINRFCISVPWRRRDGGSLKYRDLNLKLISSKVTEFEGSN